MSILRENIIKSLTRTSGWRKVRKEHITEFPNCTICGKKGQEVHHVKPFHRFPELELDKKNLTTMCRKHHFIFGHLQYWKCYNDKFRELVTLISGIYKARYEN